MKPQSAFIARNHERSMIPIIPTDTANIIARTRIRHRSRRRDELLLNQRFRRRSRVRLIYELICELLLRDGSMSWRLLRSDNMIKRRRRRLGWWRWWKHRLDILRLRRRRHSLSLPKPTTRIHVHRHLYRCLSLTLHPRPIPISSILIPSIRRLRRPRIKLRSPILLPRYNRRQPRKLLRAMKLTPLLM